MFCSLHQIKKQKKKLWQISDKIQILNFRKFVTLYIIFKGFKLNWKAVEVEPDCECNDIGTESKDCKKEIEQCTCKSGYKGAECDQCTEDYWPNLSASTGGEFQSTIDLLLFVCSRVRSRCGSWGFTLFPLTDDRNRI